MNARKAVVSRGLSSGSQNPRAIGHVTQAECSRSIFSSSCSYRLKLAGRRLYTCRVNISGPV